MNAQFGYFTPIRMCHRIMCSKINYLHEKALRLVYDSRKSTFEELLSRDKSVSVHLKNLFKYLLLKCTKYKMELPMLL